MPTRRWTQSFPVHAHPHLSRLRRETPGGEGTIAECAPQLRPLTRRFMSENLDILPLRRSAYRHGIGGLDLRQAFRVRLKTLLVENELVMVIGRSRSGEVLDIGFGHSGAIV